ncbi:ABC transporter ATP-binding protein [Acuticoccus sp. M5D2P5]|uniref:ABC transporter ATP-binding protein n=1 Tax=Acuticoccus kalidii TaxID=2910977 RepID=UPI001F3233B4|nr:ABC transporter ATP-binding protein [Acuticoccus kalidii]MCF3936144.1 ABC transporter ATP-binding protein [Acuticoccus kalidii]
MKNVEINGLTKFYGDVKAVDDIYLRVNQGEMITLLGPSGCGKSTTLNMIAGFETLDAGEIYVGDNVISSHTLSVMLPPHKRNLGMVFQSYGLWPHMTVAQNIGYGLKLRGIRGAKAKERIADALRLVRLEPYANRYPSQLSGGQQQRVSFARAVVYNPDVLLLDEPLSNLDATLREEMRFELKELQEKTGLTTIFVTHDQMEAMVMSDRIVVMQAGKIVQIGEPRDIYESPANRFVASFIGVTNFAEGEVLSRSDSGMRVALGGAVLACAARPDIAVGEKALVSIRPQDWSADTVQPEAGTPNLIESRVEKVVYLGGSYEIWTVTAGARFRIHRYGELSVSPGDTLYHWVAPERVRIIPN